MKKENVTDILYSDDYVELLRRIEEGKSPEVWSADVWEFLDRAELELGGRKAVTNRYDFAEA